MWSWLLILKFYLLDIISSISYEWFDLDKIPVIKNNNNNQKFPKWIG